MKQNIFGQASSRFKRLKPSRQYGLTVFIVTLIVISWLLAYYLKTNDQIALYQQDNYNLEQQRRTLTMTRKAIKGLNQSFKKLQFSFNELTKIDVNKKPHIYRERISTIADLASKNGLKLQSCTTKNKKTKDWFIKQNILYTTAGTISQINKFINAIQKSEHAAKCRHVAFTKGHDAIAKFDCTLQLLNFSIPTSDTPKNKISTKKRA